ncbi:MAG: hypothetical protein ACI977_000698 [Candidatus Nanohaloarchaea archaeon]|jgi:hypothetical protein
MKLENSQKILLLVLTITSLISTALSHGDDYKPGIMGWSDGGIMHNTGHMAGYNMWGMGWFGMVFGLAFWTLIILGIVYLYQEINQNQGPEDEEEQK